MAVATVVGITMLGLAVVGPTHATTPGRNGLIAFGADDGSGFEVYTISPNGTHLRQITHQDGNAYRPDWSPDGRRIAFELDGPIADTAHVVIIRADGSHLHDLTTSELEFQPAFTPDGDHLVYECGDCAGKDGIFIMRTDGTHRRRLTTSPFTDTGDHNAEVSPDGKTVTFVRNKVDAVLQALFAIDRNGSNLRRIVPYSSEVAIKHDWAPDGHQIVITTNGDYPNGKSPNVATIRPDGSHLRMLTHYTGGQQGAFAGSYSPDGRWIVFRVENVALGSYKLFKVHPDGSNRTLIASLPFAPRGIDWGAQP